MESAGILPAALRAESRRMESAQMVGDGMTRKTKAQGKRQKAKGKNEHLKCHPFAFCLLPFALCLVFSGFLPAQTGPQTYAVIITGAGDRKSVVYGKSVY